VTDTASSAGSPGERIPITTAPNLRDLGGWRTSDGAIVRHGVVHRSAELAKLGGDDLVAFAARGIRTMYDLRTAAERAVQPDHLPAGTQLTILDVLADEIGAAPAQLAEALQRPAGRCARAGRRQGPCVVRRCLPRPRHAPSALGAYRQLFSELADGAHRPALFHCTTGKDRTGWGAAALLMLLGVGDDDVVADYLLTNDELLPQLQPIFDRVQTAGGDPSSLRPVLGVDASYLEASIEHMDATYGDVHRHFSRGLEIPDVTLERLRDARIAAAS
jgi:protein-tyrosine phosphatase